MTTYRCRKGCTNGVDAGGKPRPAYHPGLWACPKETTYDAGKTARYGERRETAKAALRGEVTKPSEPAAGAAPAPGAPAPSPTLQRIELGTKIAETARRDASQAATAQEWELPAESAETFFLTIRNGFRMVAHWLDDVLDAEKTEEGRIKESIFELNQHDTAAARGGFGRRLATKVVKALGAKTLEEGIATVDSLAFLMMFGTMFLALIGHFWKVAEQSPRLKKFREKAKAAAEKRAADKKAVAERRALSEAEKKGAVTVEAKPAGAPG